MIDIQENEILGAPREDFDAMVQSTAFNNLICCLLDQAALHAAKAGAALAKNAEAVDGKKHLMGARLYRDAAMILTQYGSGEMAPVRVKLTTSPMGPTS